jgi:hypothetical protein
MFVYSTRIFHRTDQGSVKPAATSTVPTRGRDGSVASPTEPPWRPPYLVGREARRGSRVALTGTRTIDPLTAIGSSFEGDIQNIIRRITS